MTPFFFGHSPFFPHPLPLCSSGDDEVRVYTYCPALGRGVLSTPAYRKSKHLTMSLPNEFAGEVLHFYGFVTDYAQRASETLYFCIEEEEEEETTFDMPDSLPQYAMSITSATSSPTKKAPVLSRGRP